MVIRFVDGPAAGVVLTLHRTPLMLRAVQDLEIDAGAWDALDQLDDSPKPSERIYVYRLDRSSVRRVHFYRRPSRGSGWHVAADYYVLAEQPDDSQVRDNAAWREWAQAHVEDHG